MPRELLEAARRRREAAAVLAGSRSQVMYGDLGRLPEAAHTAIIYEAAWALVHEGILRPGKRAYGNLNAREDGFCLTTAGQALRKSQLT
jgi:hypothetical protein